MGTGVTSNDVDPLVVVIPHHQCTAAEYREIGEHLRRWLETRPYAREVIGLEALEAGQRPVSPGYYIYLLSKKYSLTELQKRYPHDCFPAALLVVAGGYEIAAIEKDLETDLAAICDRLAVYRDPVTIDPLFN